MPWTNLPFLSPYLHPLRLSTNAGGHHELWFDHCIGGRKHKLSATEERVLSVLWPTDATSLSPAVAPAALRALAEEVGPVALSHAVDGLFGRGFLYADPASCDDALFATLRGYLSDRPLIDQVELTNRCPMQCGFCPRGVTGAITRQRGDMRLALFESLLDQLPAGQQSYHPLELDLMGESLLHPELDRFVAAATRRGIPSELSVNPSLLTPELSCRLLMAGISRLVISLDGMDDATLALLRGKAASYTAAERNLLALIDLVGGAAEPPEIIIQMIDLARNRAQQPAFLDKWRNTGKPFVTAYIKPLDGDDPDTGQPNETRPRFLCTYPFASVCVLWDGKVVPCCRDAEGIYVLGNLEEQSLADIWRGERAEALRQDYLRDDFAAGHLCSDCAWRRTRYARGLWERHPNRAVFEPMHW